MMGSGKRPEVLVKSRLLLESALQQSVVLHFISLAVSQPSTYFAAVREFMVTGFSWEIFG
jgi:hypothetical protein